MKKPFFCLSSFLIFLLYFCFLGFFASAKEQLFFCQKESFFSSPQTPIVQENTFQTTAPVSIIETKVLMGLTGEKLPKREIREYVVQGGDTLYGIAEKFNISPETVLWVNNLRTNSKILPGQKLTILPVSGLIHLVKKGETLSLIAQRYKADISDIISFNELPEAGEIFDGDLLIIPGGRMPPESNSSSFVSNSSVPSSYFICPIPSPCGITQGLHFYNAVDFSNGRCGEPVFAVALGKVQKTGYHSVAGNFIMISHPNNTVTFYGHLSRILVAQGQEVSQGEIIGFTGNTGFTVGITGCHLHFETRGTKNPFAR